MRSVPAVEVRSYILPWICGRALHGRGRGRGADRAYQVGGRSRRDGGTDRGGWLRVRVMWGGVGDGRKGSGGRAREDGRAERVFGAGPENRIPYQPTLFS